MKQVASLLLMCDQHDLGLSINAGGDGVDTPRIFLYDAFPGGIGFSEPLYRMHADLMRRTRELIAGCPCENGCPTCVGPAGQTGPRAKAVALRLLDLLPASAAGLPAAIDEVPF
jgi:DEAD/DEAH box helicase domain-containing protein